MRRFQEAGRSTSSTPEGAAGCPPPISLPEAPSQGIADSPQQDPEKPPRSALARGLQTYPDKAQKTPSADYRRQEIRRGRRYKESRPAGGRKVAQEEEK